MNKNSFHPSSNPELFLAYVSVLSAGKSPATTFSTTTTITKATDTDVSGIKGKGLKTGVKFPTFPALEIPKITLPSPSFPAIDFLVNECALTRARVDRLQHSAEFIFKAVAPLAEVKATTSNIHVAAESIKGNTADSAHRLSQLEEKMDAQGKVLASILKNQEDMMKILQTIADKPASFTADDRSSLSKVLQNHSVHTTSIQEMSTNVRALLVHVLPHDNPEGERCAKELTDELISKVNATTPGTPISPYIQQTSQPEVTAEEEAEEEEEDPADEEEEDEEIRHYGGKDDDDDDLQGPA